MQPIDQLRDKYDMTTEEIIEAGENIMQQQTEQTNSRALKTIQRRIEEKEELIERGKKGNDPLAEKYPGAKTLDPKFEKES